MNRDRTDRALDGLVVIGAISASEVAEENTVLVTMLGEGPADVDPTQDHADADDVEQVAGCELWGNGALCARPAAPDASGAPEGLCLRIGDGREVIGWIERRWQPELDAGEVVLRALGEGAPTVRLHPDGTITITGAKVVVASDDINLTGDSPSDALALASKVDTAIDHINSALDALAIATPVPNDGGAALQAAFVVAWTSGGTPPQPPSDVGSAKVKAE